MERGIAIIILLVALAFVTVGPMASEAEPEGCAALESLGDARMEQLLDELTGDGELLDQRTLERHGIDDVPLEALPCLRERLRERLASASAEVSLRT